MKKTAYNKLRLIAATVVITFLSSSFLCCNPLGLKGNDGVGEIQLFEMATINIIRLSNRADNQVSPEQFKYFDYQIDTNERTEGEAIVSHNSDPDNENNQIESTDTTKYNMFGDLLKSDPYHNQKEPLWVPIAEVLGVHALIGLTNRYVFDADYARVGFKSWEHNLNAEWEWDTDRFGMNFLGHPYSGGLNFMAARSVGYNFWESIPFTVGGSLVWEYFGENTLPAYNDLFNTPVSGVFYGEVLYRLSSNLLDDRTSGTERFFREFGAAVLSPTRFFNRLVHGDLTRVTSEEIYMKKPLNIELSGGMRKVNHENDFGTGSNNLMFSIQLNYGYPFEKIDRRPYDYFQVRTEVNMGVGRKILNTFTGYGLLYGKNSKHGDLEMLAGIFHHYNYFDNTTFELGAAAFGGGLMTRYPIFQNSYLFSNLHLAVVPLAGNSTRFGPNVSELGDYNYGGGAELKLESGLNLFWGSIQFIGYYFWIHTYEGFAGDNYIGLIKPRITLNIYQNVNIGFEQLVYFTDRYTKDHGNHHIVRTEQKLYITVNVGNFKL